MARVVQFIFAILFCSSGLPSRANDTDICTASDKRITCEQSDGTDEDLVSEASVELFQTSLKVVHNTKRKIARTGKSQARVDAVHWSKFDMKTFRDQGYVILEDVFTHQEIDAFADQVASYIAQNGSLLRENFGGHTIVDFRFDPSLASIFTSIDQNQKIHRALSQAVGDCNLDDQSFGPSKCNYRFCSHNDIGVNRNATWHKDRLNGLYRVFEHLNPWGMLPDNSTMRIVKVALYLENHHASGDHDALRVMPSSHTTEEIPEEKYGVRFLHPKKGDVVLFDQRITHRGRGPESFTEHPEHDMSLLSTGGYLRKDDNRIMVSLGYGHNNVFTDEFEEGTMWRQSQWNDEECGYTIDNACSALKVAKTVGMEKFAQSGFCDELPEEAKLQCRET